MLSLLCLYCRCVYVVEGVFVYDYKKLVQFYNNLEDLSDVLCQSLSRIGNHRETEWSVDFTKTIRLIVRSGCSVYNRTETDFLTRLNDDQNICALFERALSSLPLKDSVEVWKKFVQFEQTYGEILLACLR
ncbi:cleavage stimulation factor subunit [Trifolium repens]|nr:cleavage stimulation factor subunit [Trifolium repens]